MLTVIIWYCMLGIIYLGIIYRFRFNYRSRSARVYKPIELSYRFTQAQTEKEILYVLPEMRSRDSGNGSFLLYVRQREPSRSRKATSRKFPMEMDCHLRNRRSRFRPDPCHPQL